MKTIRIMTLILLAASLVMAAESTVNLDRCAVLNDPGDAGAPSKIAMHFVMLDEIQNREVIYSALSFTIPDLKLNRDANVEISLYPILEDWSESDIKYDEITDNLSIGSFTIKLGATNQFNIDIAPYVRQIIEDGRSNFGLIGVVEVLDDSNIQLPDNSDAQIMNSAEVKIVYK